MSRPLRTLHGLSTRVDGGGGNRNWQQGQEDNDEEKRSRKNKERSPSTQTPPKHLPNRLATHHCPPEKIIIITIIIILYRQAEGGRGDPTLSAASIFLSHVHSGPFLGTQVATVVCEVGRRRSVARSKKRGPAPRIPPYRCRVHTCMFGDSSKPNNRFTSIEICIYLVSSLLSHT